MKISKKFSQFEAKKILIIVTSRQNAHLYQINSGHLDLIKEINTKKPHFSDDEGASFRSGHGKNFGTGFVKELSDKEIKKELLDQLSNWIKLTDISSFDEIFIFSPSHMIKEVLAIFKHYKEKIQTEFQGNYIKSHPTVLLEKINNQEK